MNEFKSDFRSRLALHVAVWAATYFVFLASSLLKNVI